MTVAEQHGTVTPEKGRVALRIPLFDTPNREFAHAVKRPWPRWMRRLYELEELTNEEIDAEEGETAASAAVSALATDLKHRLDIVAFATAMLEGQHWDIELVGSALVATARMTPYQARHLLEDIGVAGPLCAVCELDDSGWPRMWYGGDA